MNWARRGETLVLRWTFVPIEANSDLGGPNYLTKSTRKPSQKSLSAGGFLVLAQVSWMLIASCYQGSCVICIETGRRYCRALALISLHLYTTSARGKNQGLPLYQIGAGKLVSEKAVRPSGSPHI